MSRSLKKGPFIDAKLMEKVSKLRVGDKTVVKTWARASTITPEMVGFTFAVHNGRNFIQVRVEENMVGHKLGEFSATRKFFRHGGKVAEIAVGGAAVPGAAVPKTASAKPAAKK
ncbi:MAG: 30S ribosomal protein S19 [Patescibacteria group bacterium]|jgi:small subunit ribosomal protein S19